MATATPEYVGLAPSDHGEGGGGLIEDVDAVIVKARFEEFEYVNKAGVSTGKGLVLKVDYEPQGKNLRPFNEVYSAGSQLKASVDGKNLMRPPGSTVKLKKDSNTGIFLERACAADPHLAAALNTPAGVSVLDGRAVHLIRIAQPDRGSRVGKKDATMLVISAFLATKGAAPTNGSVDVDGEAISAIMEVLTETSPVTKAKLSQLLFKALDGNPARQQIMNRATQADFLSESDLWTFDGKSIAIAE